MNRSTQTCIIMYMCFLCTAIEIIQNIISIFHKTPKDRTISYQKSATHSISGISIDEKAHFLTHSTMNLIFTKRFDSNFFVHKLYEYFIDFIFLFLYEYKHFIHTFAPLPRRPSHHSLSIYLSLLLMFAFCI